jgi:hypothetical protein
LYKWQGIGQPSPPCAYIEGATIYDLEGKATHMIVRGRVAYSLDDLTRQPSTSSITGSSSPGSEAEA